MSEAKKKALRGRPKGTNSQVVYETLRSRILNLELKPGENISEPAIVQELGMSRTPVREALLRLASEGMVEILPNQGARVVTLDIAQVSELLEALELCERAVNKWAAVNRSDEDLEAISAHHDAFALSTREVDFHGMGNANNAFHIAIGRASGNSIIADLYESLLNGGLRLYRLMYVHGYEAIKKGDPYYDVLISHHEELIEAIRTGDADRAEKVGADHSAVFRSQVARFMVKTRTKPPTIAEKGDISRIRTDLE